MRKQHEIIEALESLKGLPMSTARAAEYLSLAGEDPSEAYRMAEEALAKVMEYAESARNELATLRSHAHSWNEDDYCSVCGADGRA